jgi:hypothetical protein
MGTSFSRPWFISTVYGTIAPFRNSFLEIGLDVGLISGGTDVGYYSLYPFARYALFLPFGKNAGWYTGLGGGCLIAKYSFPEGENDETIPALDLATGFIIVNMINISYSLRTNFNIVNHKVSAGYVKRF